MKLIYTPHKFMFCSLAGMYIPSKSIHFHCSSPIPLPEALFLIKYSLCSVVVDFQTIVWSLKIKTNPSSHNLAVFLTVFDSRVYKYRERIWQIIICIDFFVANNWFFFFLQIIYFFGRSMPCSKDDMYTLCISCIPCIYLYFICVLYL